MVFTIDKKFLFELEKFELQELILKASEKNMVIEVMDFGNEIAGLKLITPTVEPNYEEKELIEFIDKFNIGLRTKSSGFVDKIKIQYNTKDEPLLRTKVISSDDYEAWWDYTCDKTKDGNYTNFIIKSLNIRIRDTSYENVASICINEKEFGSIQNEGFSKITKYE